MTLQPWRRRLAGVLGILALVAHLAGCAGQRPPSSVQALPESLTRYTATTLFPSGVTSQGRAPASFVATGKYAMVASEGEPATQIALDVLKAGGNAVDAAVALSFAISVYRPQSTGIGGGGFLLFHSAKEGRTVALDMRERAPLKAKRDMFLKGGKPVPELSLRGGLSVATPGLVAGLWEAHRRLGSKKIPWKHLVLPAARLAREGFEVYPYMAEAVKELHEKGWLAKFPETRKLLTRVDGTPIQPGDRYRNPDLARALETIAEKGKDGFYKGWVAKEILAAVKRTGGILTQADLDAYQVKERQPVRGTYRSFEVVSMPPPSSGGVHVIQMLNMLEKKGEVLGRGFDHPDAVHLKIETMRRAYADRSVYLGDPDFYRVPVKGLLSKTYADTLVKGINLEKASPSQAEVKAGKPAAFEKTSTTHFSIVDQEGNAVAATQTINYDYGSGVVAGGTGIFLNDEMDDFSVQPGQPNVYGLVGGEANAIAPKKTPLSSMTPTILLEKGKVRLVLGSPGGSRIITSVLNVILNVVDHDLDLRDAVFAPRVHHQWLPDVVQIDKAGFTPRVLEALAAKGHKLEEKPIGNVSAVWVNPQTGERVGVADPRREGKPMGF